MCFHFPEKAKDDDDDDDLLLEVLWRVNKGCKSIDTFFSKEKSGCYNSAMKKDNVHTCRI